MDMANHDSVNAAVFSVYMRKNSSLSRSEGKGPAMAIRANRSAITNGTATANSVALVTVERMGLKDMGWLSGDRELDESHFKIKAWSSSPWLCLLSRTSRKTEIAFDMSQ